MFLRSVGLRLQLVLALGALTLVAFVPLYLAVAGLTRHTLRGVREEGARALGRAIAGRVLEALAYEKQNLADVLEVSVDREGSDGAVAVKVIALDGSVRASHGNLSVLAALPTVAPREHPGEQVRRILVSGTGGVAIWVLELEVASSRGVVQVALRIGDEASRAVPLLRLVAFYTAAFALVLIALAYLLLTRRMVQPIAELVDGVQRIDGGDRRALRLIRSRQLGGAREVVELAEAFERTTGKLFEREDALALKIQQLETARGELLAVRDQVIRSERLASVGRLSAGLAHEIGNPIAALMGLEDVLLGGELDEDTRDLIQRMKRETERVHLVLRDLLDFARAGDGPRSSDQSPDGTPNITLVREVIDDVQALLRPQKSMQNIRLNVALAPNLPPVKMSAGKLQQVLLNLLINAADALVGRVDASIEVRAQHHGAFVVVEVEDNGPGITPAIQAVLFEPFVTTKDVGHGTGLGLAVCRGLVDAEGGSIELLPIEATKGACFRIELPLASKPGEEKR